MILCLVDDLIFSIKISTAAKAIGAEIYFERAADTVLSSIRDKKPALVILDLNSGKMRPLDVIAAVKADDELKGIRTLGFVSHVHADVIAMAREAGIDEVLARSAFSDRLGEILRSAGTAT
ncbi:MAG: response regulator transcription factor [Acidimicrobiia bacterium]|nr:response regulator transcription factor [Acidimicrobiia bacterium]